MGVASYLEKHAFIIDANQKTRMIMPDANKHILANVSRPVSFLTHRSSIRPPKSSVLKNTTNLSANPEGGLLGHSFESGPLFSSL